MIEYKFSYKCYEAYVILCHSDVKMVITRFITMESDWLFGFRIKNVFFRCVYRLQSGSLPIILCPKKIPTAHSILINYEFKNRYQFCWIFVVYDAHRTKQQTNIPFTIDAINLTEYTKCLVFEERKQRALFSLCVNISTNFSSLIDEEIRFFFVSKSPFCSLFIVPVLKCCWSLWCLCSLF